MKKKATHAVINDNKVLQHLTHLSIQVHPRPSVTVQQVLIHYLINRFEKLIPSQTWSCSFSSSTIHLCLTHRQHWGIPIQHTVLTPESQHVCTQKGGLSKRRKKKLLLPICHFQIKNLSSYFCYCVISACTDCKVVRIKNAVMRGMKTYWKPCQ